MPRISKKLSRKVSKLSLKSKKKFSKKGGANNNNNNNNNSMNELASRMGTLATNTGNNTFANLVEATKKNLREIKRRKSFGNLVNTAKNKLRETKGIRNFRKGLNEHAVNFSGNKKHSYKRYTRRSKPLNKMPTIDENSDIPLSVLDLDRLSKYLKTNPEVTRSLFLRYTRIPRNNPTPDQIRSYKARSHNFSGYQNETYGR
jgi:hypothetical protein